MQLPFLISFFSLKQIPRLGKLHNIFG